ncbi:transcriptional regulator NrdR [Planctomycetota bacterium]
MRCPFCRTDNDKVIDSRASNEGAVIRRRRECLSCKRRYTTYERQEEFPLRVVKKDGSRVPFQRDKLITGLLKACEKRPVSIKQLDSIIDDLERHVNELFDREISSSYLGEYIMRRLKDVDQVAYVRFASVYREFKDIHEFLDELKPMMEEFSQ